VRARGGLGGEWCAVVGRAALHDVADVDTVAAVTHRGDHTVEQLACSADEREALLVLVKAWAFAYEDEVGIRGPSGEDAVGSASAQLAAGALGSFLGEHLEAGRGVLIAPVRPGPAQGRLKRGCSLGHWKSRAAERFLPPQKLLGALNDRREVVFRVTGHVGASIGRFR
jgi:hypothetical protein